MLRLSEIVGTGSTLSFVARILKARKSGSRGIAPAGTEVLMLFPLLQLEEKKLRGSVHILLSTSALVITSTEAEYMRYLFITHSCDFPITHKKLSLIILGKSFGTSITINNVSA